MPGPTPSEPRHPVRAWPTSYAIAAVVFAVIDLVWLGVVAQPLYQDQLGHLLADEFNLVPAAAFYFLYPLGVTVRDAAIYGFMTYMTWDLTSAAVFRDFPTLVVFIDITWGTSASVAVAALTWWLTHGRRSRGRAGGSLA